MKLGNKVIDLSAQKGDIKLSASLQNKVIEKTETVKEESEIINNIMSDYANTSDRNENLMSKDDSDD